MLSAKMGFEAALVLASFLNWVRGFHFQNFQLAKEHPLECQFRRKPAGSLPIDAAGINRVSCSRILGSDRIVDLSRRRIPLRFLPRQQGKTNRVSAFSKYFVSSPTIDQCRNNDRS